MKKLLFSLLLLVSVSVLAQNGYEIKVTLKPFKKQYVYLGHYFGKSYPIIDSALLDDNSQAIFKGKAPLNGGIYLIGYPNKSGFFEILVDREQQFSVIADTATLAKGVKFINSKDNELFNEYQQQMNQRGQAVNKMQQQLKEAKTKDDSTRIIAALTKADKDITDFREALIKNNSGRLLANLLVAMREPILTGNLKDPKTKTDSTASYQFFKSHYWDGVNFYDGRLAYTTFFEDKLDKYFNQLVVPHPDSVIKEIDWMMSYAGVSPEMSRFLLIKFVNKYIYQKYMWEDAVFVHLFEKYFSNREYNWLTEKGKKTITDRAYSLMANIMGTPAADILLPDPGEKMQALYELSADFTLVVFWDPTCGHCKEVLPRLDSFYTAKWKGEGMKVYAVARETEGTKKDWLNFIAEKKLEEWTNVFYTRADDRARTDAGVPGYAQLYDVQSFPTLYLLDKDKRIIAKKLSVDQIDDILDVKLGKKQ